MIIFDKILDFLHLSTLTGIESSWKRGRLVVEGRRGDEDNGKETVVYSHH